MKSIYWMWLAVVLFIAGLSGCSKDAPPEKGDKAKAAKPSAEKPSEEDEFKANLAKLDPADRKLAEAQVYCAVHDKSRLGSMGVPIKVMVKDQPVFLCCDGCQKSAEAHPEKTLAKAEELKKKSAPP
jgi:hypothetical protein